MYAACYFLENKFKFLVRHFQLIPSHGFSLTLTFDMVFYQFDLAGDLFFILVSLLRNLSVSKVGRMAGLSSQKKKKKKKK